MQPIAAALSAGEADQLVAYYAAADRVASTVVVSSGARERGERIANGGSPADDLPACLACHSGQASAHFPLLAGLSAEYIAGQLHVFRSRLRDNSSYGAIMTTIAARLSPDQIADVAAYFAALPPSGGTSSAGGSTQ
jgi:cytochrome c553